MEEFSFFGTPCTYFCIYGTISKNVIVRGRHLFIQKFMRIKKTKTCSSVFKDILYNQWIYFVYY